MLRSIGRFSILLLIFISTIFLTCSKDSTGPKEQGILIKASDGGTITSPDGLLTLSIPAEALDNDTYINVEIVDETDYPNELDSINTLGEVYELQPDGITFNKAVFIEVETSTTDFENIVVDEKYPILSCIMLTSDGELSIIDSTTVEYNISDKSGKVSGQIDHFCVITRTIDFFTAYTSNGWHAGQINVSADLGPDESHVGVAHSASLEIINNTEYDFQIEIVYYSNNSIVEWPKNDRTADISGHSNQTINLPVQWTCKEIGTGKITVELKKGYTPYYNINQTFIISSKECKASVDDGDDNDADFCGDQLFYPGDSFFDVFFDINACDFATDQVSLADVIWSGFGHPDHIRPLNHLSSFAIGGVPPLMLTGDQVNQFDTSWPCNEPPITPGIFSDGFESGDVSEWQTVCPDGAGKVKVVGNTAVVENPLVFINVLHANIPKDDPTNIFTYAFVFDRDGNTANNYQPIADYPNDFFKDTDYWIELFYAPGWGWGMAATDAANNSFTPVTSDAKIIMLNNTLILVIPRSEFLAENIGYRMTTFRHTGDWGMSDDNWDGDVQPPVADGLNWLYIGP